MESPKLMNIRRKKQKNFTDDSILTVKKKSSKNVNIFKEPVTDDDDEDSDDDRLKPFQPIINRDATNTVKIKIPDMCIDSPNFYINCYCVKPTTSHNTLTINASDMSFYLSTYDINFYICLQHALSQKPIDKCIHCMEFLTFNHAFAIQTRFNFYIFPPPILNNNRSLNFFKAFIELAVENINKLTHACINEGMKKERIYYNNFIIGDFRQGSLKDNISGKRSFVRNKILAYQTKGMRAVLTIDCELTPHYISIPQRVYDTLDLATNLVIVNRAPSIKDTCIYVAEILRNKEPNDYTIHINPYMTDGLHADQDGDEISIFYIEKQDDEPSSDMEAAIIELRNCSWKYGTRHNFAYKCRYSFTQYHRYLLHIFNDFFCQHNALWKKLEDDGHGQKADRLMNLGCSILHQEVDDFLELVSTVTRSLNCLITPISEILKGDGDISAVVDSGAKGTHTHIKTYLNHLFHSNGPNYEKLIAGFNKYVTSSSDMKLGGFRQFIFLYGVNPVYMHNNRVYANNEVILEGLRDADSMAGYYHNIDSVEYVAKDLINDLSPELHLSDYEVDLEMKKYL